MTCRARSAGRTCETQQNPVAFVKSNTVMLRFAQKERWKRAERRKCVEREIIFIDEQTLTPEELEAPDDGQAEE